MRQDSFSDRVFQLLCADIAAEVQCKRNIILHRVRIRLAFRVNALLGKGQAAGFCVLFLMPAGLVFCLFCAFVQKAGKNLVFNALNASGGRQFTYVDLYAEPLEEFCSQAYSGD